MYTKNLSFVICPSVNRNNIFSSLGPLFPKIFYRSTLRSFIPYVADIVIWKVTIPIIKDDNLERDYLPEPPTPTNKA